MKTVKILVLTAICALLAAILLPGYQRSPRRASTTSVMEDLRMIDAAMNQYAIKYGKEPGAPVTWADVQPFLGADTSLYHSNGADKLGGIFRLSTVGTPPNAAETTLSALSDVAPPEFWSPYR